jgi:hypothetical protein
MTRLIFSPPQRRLRDGENFRVLAQVARLPLDVRIMAILLRHELRGRWPT